MKNKRKQLKALELKKVNFKLNYIENENNN